MDEVGTTILGIQDDNLTPEFLTDKVKRDLSAKCQLPEVIPVGTHGNFIRRPEAWK